MIITLFFLILFPLQILTNQKPIIWVSIAPQAGIVKKIAGDFFNVNTLLPKGSSPETYNLKPKEIHQLQGGYLYFYIGLPFEKILLKKIKNLNPDMPLKDLSENIKKRRLDEPGKTYEIPKIKNKQYHHNHSHNPGEEDPHVWLSIKNQIIMAKNITHTLSSLQPEKKNFFESNFKKFEKQAMKIDQNIRKKLEKLENRHIFVFHPAFGYFADDYNLTQVPIETEGKEPTIKQLISIIELYKKLDAKIILLQPEFSSKAAETIAKEVGANVIPFSPLDENLFENLQTLADKITFQ